MSYVSLRSRPVAPQRRQQNLLWRRNFHEPSWTSNCRSGAARKTTTHGSRSSAPTENAAPGRAPSGVDSALYGALRAVFAAFGGRSRSHARRLRRLARSLTGIGKTHLAIGLGVKAAHAGHSALFDTASNWITRLTGAHRGNRLEAELEKIRRYKLIIIDEVGYIPFDQDAAHLFFQLIASRYEQGSIMVTSNLPFGRWGQTFADDDVAAAMIDRLVHHAEVLTLTGDSYRTRAPRALRAKDRTAD